MAAATATFPASMSSGYQQPSRRSNLAYQPFDANLLARKLEAHRCAQISRERAPASTQPYTDNENVSPHATTRRASYVPRMAAAQFAATTTPMNKRPASPPYQRAYSITNQHPDATFNESNLVNPKHLRLSAGQDQDANAPTGVQYATFTVADASRRTSTANQVFRSRKPSHQSISEEGESGDLLSPSSSAPARGYRPGDAARRNAYKRASGIIPMPHNGTSPSAMLRASTGSDFYRNQLLIDLSEEECPAAARKDSTSVSDNDDSASDKATIRSVHATDRPNWSQQSECGDDDEDDGFRIPTFPRWSRHEDEAKTSAVEQPVSYLRTKARQASAPAPAVAKTVPKKEEKPRRRESVMGFFKRK